MKVKPCSEKKIKLGGCFCDSSPLKREYWAMKLVSSEINWNWWQRFLIGSQKNCCDWDPQEGKQQLSKGSALQIAVLGATGDFHSMKMESPDAYGECLKQCFFTNEIADDGGQKMVWVFVFYLIHRGQTGNVWDQIQCWHNRCNSINLNGVVLTSVGSEFETICKLNATIKTKWKMVKGLN